MSRAAECDELLRIEEDTQWQADEIINLSEEQTIDIAMIEQLREAVDLLQDSNSGQIQMDMSSLEQNKDKSPTMSPTTNTTIPFGLKPRSVFLRPQRNLESIDPQFTIRRKMEQMREERELVEQLREPKLSMAKCRRNVENFLDACRKLGIPEEKLCLPHHILEEKGLVKVSITVQALLDVTTVKQALFT
ncbi:Leucine-rich repeat and calponin like proteiny domain-containing protein 1 [Turdus rufiventris]|nr:Leucine-rich repeat and calponin like proteiny domain-containing protein 1 [Turdus rufiventris]